MKQIGSGYTFSTFLTENGEVYVCGHSKSGGLGLAQFSNFVCQHITKNEFIQTKIIQIDVVMLFIIVDWK